MEPSSTRSALPRALTARAARLLSSVIEVTIDLHGRDGARALVETPGGVRALSALAGGPLDARARAFVDDALLRGLDEVRLGLSVPALFDEAPVNGARRANARTPSSSTKAAGAKLPRAPLLSLAARHFSAKDIDAHLLGALLRAARAPAPAHEDAHTERLLREPGIGPRARFALAVVALRVVDPWREFSPALAALALGSIDGAPYGVPLVVYDRVNAVLDALLAGEGARPRGGALVSLASLVVEHARAARPTAREARLVTLVRRERAHARDYLALTSEGVFDGARAPRLPRKRARTAERRAGFVPYFSQPGTRAAQGDLFAP